MRLVSSARLKIDIKDAIVLSLRILLNQQIPSSKTKITLKMMIELNWKLFVLSLAVINPTLPTSHFTYIAVHYILSCYHGNTVTKGTLQNEAS